MEEKPINLSVRLAGLFGTAVFLMTSMPHFFKEIQPYDIGQMANGTISGIDMMETLILSMGGGIGAGFIGYIIGDILSHPDVRRARKKVVVKKQVKEFNPAASFNLLELQPDSPLYEPPPEVPNVTPPAPNAPSVSEAAPPAPPPVEGS